MAGEDKTLYLIDGSSYLHRAYHAIPRLSNSKGFPTHVALGFTKMILKLLTEKRPKYLVIVFDAKGPTFRHRLFEAYKANRPPMPEDLAVQIPVTKEIVRHLNLRMIEKEGVEADDVIGTLARIGEDRGFRVVMVTGDKDFRQLITPKTSMWDTMKETVLDYSTLKATYGVEPEGFIDVMGLSGDTSDNIPGVPGVGEKTALDLIKRFGSMEAVFDHLDTIPGKRLKENLAQSKDMARLSKELVTIDRFVPLPEGLEDLAVGEPDREGLAQIFRDMEFKGLWEQFAPRETQSVEYQTILSLDVLRERVGRIRAAGLVCVDTETTSPDPLRAGLVGLSFSWEEGKAFYIPVAHSYWGVPPQISWAEAKGLLKDLLEDEKVLKVGQNIKYDAEVLRSHGVEMRGIHFDTMVASYVINPGLRQHNLGLLAQQYLNHKMIAYKDVVGQGKEAVNFSAVPMEVATSYSCEDADITLRLTKVLGERLKADQNEELFYDLEMKLIPVLMEMEISGIRIDSAFFQEMSARFSQEIKAMEREIHEEAGMEFNINSPQQLAFVLFERLQLPGMKKTPKTRQPSTDVKVLQKLAAYPFKIPRLLLRYRTLTKLKSTYLDALVNLVHPESGRVHTSFNQTVTATGRLSSSNPNLQNIPVRGEEGREIRRGFVADGGNVLVSADYSQVELRIFAHYSEDEAFMEAFRRNEDIHTRTAGEILGMNPEDITPEKRHIAKAINFGIIYGMGPQKLSEELGIELKVAKEYISTYYQRYGGVARYREAMIEKARNQGYVTTLLNRRRYLPDIHHPKPVIRAEAERMAINTPIQGTAADLIKMAMVRIHKWLSQEKAKTRMLLQVHDELLFEVPEGELGRVVPVIKEEMEGAYPLRVPLKVDIGQGRNWEEAH